MTQRCNGFTSLDDWLREEGIYAETVKAAQAKVEALRVTTDPDTNLSMDPEHVAELKPLV